MYSGLHDTHHISPWVSGKEGFPVSCLLWVPAAWSEPRSLTGRQGLSIAGTGKAWSIIFYMSKQPATCLCESRIDKHEESLKKKS